VNLRKRQQNNEHWFVWAPIVAWPRAPGNRPARLIVASVGLREPSGAFVCSEKASISACEQAQACYKQDWLRWAYCRTMRTQLGRLGPNALAKSTTVIELFQSITRGSSEALELVHCVSRPCK